MTVAPHVRLASPSTVSSCRGRSMLAASFFMSPQDLWNRIGTPDAPQIVDVRRRDIYEAASHVLPASVWPHPRGLSPWAAPLDRARPIVVACKRGEQLSQLAAAELRGLGFQASALEGGQA